MAKAKKTEAPEFAEHVDKEASPSTELFVEWLEEHTGYEVDPISVKLARALVGTFQKSDVNQERLAAAREAKHVAELERATAAGERKAKAKAEKSAPKKRARKVAPAEEDGAEAPESKPAAKKAAPARRRRRPAATAAEGI